MEKTSVLKRLPKAGGQPLEIAGALPPYEAKKGRALLLSEEV